MVSHVIGAASGLLPYPVVLHGSASKQVVDESAVRQCIDMSVRGRDGRRKEVSSQP